MEAIILIILLLIAVREGLQLAGLRKYWKPVSWLIRALLVLLLWPDLTLMLTGAVLAWSVYNVSCAIGLGQKWWYLGTTSVIDKFKIINYISQVLIVIALIYSLL
jgi:hypothetical protein